MSITQQQLDAAVWGTGYGNRRHLIDHAESNALPASPRTGLRYDAKVRCSRGIFVDQLDSTYDAGLVAKRQPCARCQKIADREAQQ